ncbi:hypothetical protein ACW4TU_00200 [Streptomyces sp. QTS52]
MTGNQWVQMRLASNNDNVIRELRSVLLQSDLGDLVDRPEGSGRDAALSMTLENRGARPPWPRSAGEAAAWQIRQMGKLLRQAEVLVISPAAHAAVMAAAATLEPTDVSTLGRDRDILVRTGLLVLPEPVVVVVAPAHCRIRRRSAGSSSPSTRSCPRRSTPGCG